MPKRPRATCQVNPKSLYLLGLDYVPSRKLKGRFGRDASDGVFYQSNSDSHNKRHNVAVAQKKKSIAARLETQMLGPGLEEKKEPHVHWEEKGGSIQNAIVSKPFQWMYQHVVKHFGGFILAVSPASQ